MLAGSSLAAIARRWNAQGFTTPRTGSLWGVPSVRVALLNPRHAGLLARAKMVNGRKVGYDIIGDADWPAIITRDEHDRLQHGCLDDPARHRGTGTSKDAHEHDALRGVRRHHAGRWAQRLPVRHGARVADLRQGTHPKERHRRLDRSGRALPLAVACRGEGDDRTQAQADQAGRRSRAVASRA